MSVKNANLIYEIAKKKIIEQSSLNAIVSLTPYVETDHKGQLSNLTYVIKDNFCRANDITTGSSRFLKNFYSGYDSTVFKLLKNSGAIQVATTVLDEFGLGGTGTFACTGVVLNPKNHLRISGGSSSGSAALVATKAVDFALGSDTGDSVRKPAGYVGVIGYKPTYGLISRYGIMPYAPSLDHVGVFANDLNVITKVLDALCKKDDKDFTSLDSHCDFEKNLKPQLGTLVIIKNIFDHLSPSAKISYLKTIENCKKIGFKLVEVSFDPQLAEVLLPIYNILSYAEAASCYFNLTGLSFGENVKKPFEEAIIEARSKNFGSELKRRFLIGAFATSKENFERIYLKSKKVRQLIIEETKRVLSFGDALLIPSAKAEAPLISETTNKKPIFEDSNNFADDVLLLGNFAGIPSITIPSYKVNNLPWGINIMTPYKEDQKCLNIAKKVMEALSHE